MSMTDSTAAPMAAVEASSGSEAVGSPEQGPSIEWRSIPDASFDEIVTQIIVSPMTTLRELPSVFIKRESDGLTLLHVVCGWNNAHELVTLFLRAGIPANVTDSSGWTPLLEAAQEGQIPSCKVLLDFGATPNLTPFNSNLTPIRAAAEVGNESMTQWLLEQPDAAPTEWDTDFFGFLVAKTPHAAAVYMDKFAVALDHSKRGQVAVRYTGLARIYGPPSTPVDETALALAARSEHAREILSHRLMKYIMRAKWKIFGRAMFRREFAAYCTLLASYVLPTIAADPDWTHLANPSDYFVAVMRAISWLFSVLLLMTVERNEFLGGKIRTYFKSFWNVLSLFTYVLVLVTIPFEWMHTTTSKAARNSMLALINVSLWINLLQFLQVSTESGLLIAMMKHMAKDVYRFCLLYVVFVIGFSCALYLVLQGQPGYTSFMKSLITVYLLLFGQISYDPFDQAEGWTWFMSNLLLFAHLMAVVVVLLNILVAMMATTYSDVWEAAEAEALQSHASSIISKERAMTARERERKFQQALQPVLKHKKTTKVGRSRTVQPEPDRRGSSMIKSRANAKRTMIARITENVKAAPMNAIRAGGRLGSTVVSAVSGADETRPASGTQSEHDGSTHDSGGPSMSVNLLVSMAGISMLDRKHLTEWIGKANYLHEDLGLLKSALDKDDVVSPNNAGGRQLGLLEDGIRYEKPIHKRVDEDMRTTVRELRDQVEGTKSSVKQLHEQMAALHQTLLEIKTHMARERVNTTAVKAVNSLKGSARASFSAKTNNAQESRKSSVVEEVVPKRTTRMTVVKVAAPETQKPSVAAQGWDEAALIPDGFGTK